MLHLKKILVLFTLLISVCGISQQHDSVHDSFWLQEGYDRALEIKDSAYTYYNIDDTTCKTFVQGNFKERFSVVSANDSILILNPGGIVNYCFRRVDSLPDACGKPSGKTASFEKNFQVFWLSFSNNYAFFKERKINWQQVYVDYLPKVKKLKTDQEFVVLLREIIAAFHDRHIRLDIPNELNSSQNPITRKLTKTKNDVISDLQNAYVENVKSYNNGLIRWGILKNSNIGYMVLTDMNNFADYVQEPDLNETDFRKKYRAVRDRKMPLQIFEDELQGVDNVMKAILEDFKNTNSIVIDLRFNGGGYETVALKVLSYFVSTQKDILSVKAKTKYCFSKQQYYSLIPATEHYNKKVYVLTSKNTASAAEIFALGALSYSEITSIGSSSANIFSELLWKSLPNGWEFSLSNEVYSDMKSQSYEGTGVPVNYKVNYPAMQSEFFEDFYGKNEFTDQALEKVFQLEKKTK